MKIILGTMTFSDQVNERDSLRMTGLFADQGGYELDTAYQYNQGNTERLLGKILDGKGENKFRIATKVNPWDGDGLKPDEVRNQFNTSLQRLQMEAVDLLYLHSPDIQTPIEDTLSVCAEFYQQDKFKRFGLSNFAAWQVAEVVEICRHKRWMIPVVYQGMYNALTRDVERELFDCLRNYDMSFYVYNPLAGGLLTGKHKALFESPPPGRFEYSDSYRGRYWKAEYFEALSRFTQICTQHQITPTDAALRWLVHHSRLSDAQGDGIILGASRLNHLQDNMAAVKGGPLPEEIIRVLDQGWELTRSNVMKYFR